MKRQVLIHSLALAFGGLMSAAALPTLAQDAQSVGRVEITGSSIKRVDAEGALPVQVLKREDIDRSGAKSASELLQALPVFQNFTTQGDSVGGGGAGFAGAALRNLGETRTLVLLNGKRIAQSGSQALTGAQAAVNLNNIPVAAIERVEILTDGASALYGSDAIGGVVNFITRRDFSTGEASVGGSYPDKGKGTELNLSAVKGFGSLEKDGFNALIAVSSDKRDPLKSTDRDYAKTGKFRFTERGTLYEFQLGSVSPIPANIVVGQALLSPPLLLNGSCAPQTFEIDGTCFYDFTTQLEIYPEQKRDNAFLSFSTALGNHTLTADYIYSKSVTTSRLAPPPGSFRVQSTSPLWAQYVVPTAAAAGADLTGLTSVVARYRVADVGKRTTADTSIANHFSLELKGPLAGWDYAASLTHSESKYEEVLKGGWVQLNPFLAALNSGLINPFVGPGQQSAAAQQALNDAQIKGKFDGGVTTLDSFELRGSRPLFKLDGGDVQLATGVNYLKEKFNKNPSLLAQGFDANGQPDTRFGDTSAIIPYSSTRSSTAVFGELLIPVTKQFELSPSIRYDKYSDFGNTTNYKLAGRFQPAQAILFRGSIGTGFKAPTVPQINAANQSFGVTGGSYTCNGAAPEAVALAAAAARLGAICPAGGTATQYDVVAGGNKNLQPEESKQWTLGLVVEPIPNVSIGADLWEVKIKNSIGSIGEDVVFGDPNKYPQSLTTFTDPATGERLLALFAGNVNLGRSKTMGLDLNAQIRTNLGFGKLGTQVIATYLIKNDFEVVPDQGYLQDIGKFINGGPSFRLQARVINTLDHGPFKHTLTIAYRSGYADEPTEVFNVAANTFDVVERDVKAYTTVDWQTNWEINKAWSVTGGVLNLFNKKPPLSITQNGGGQMVGFDARYSDSRDRTLYGNVKFRF
jgi:iron complex outermembrane recepter protein